MKANLFSNKPICLQQDLIVHAFHILPRDRARQTKH